MNPRSSLLGSPLSRSGQICGRRYHRSHCEGQDGGFERHQEGDGSGQHWSGTWYEQVRLGGCGGVVGSFPLPVLPLSFLVPVPTCPTSLSFTFPHDLHIPFVLADSRQQVSLLAQRLSGGPGSDLQNHVAAGSGQVSGQVGVGTCVLYSWAALLRA